MAMPIDEQKGNGIEARDATETLPAQENLALFYQGLLTGIVRLQGQRQHIADAETFRRRTKATLQEVEHVAIAAGYDARDVQDTHFAVVAFLDSVILNSKDPIRVEWERRPLQQELFGQAEAGVVFFAKLDAFRSRRDSAQLADILEVFALCLLLGFEGRYAGAMRGDLEAITHRTRKRIEDIRGRSRLLSPGGGRPLEAAPPLPPPRRKDQFRLIALGAVIFTILCFGSCFLLLNSNLSQTSEQLRRLF